MSHFGTTRHFAARHQFGRYRGSSGHARRRTATGSGALDPEQTSTRRTNRRPASAPSENVVIGRQDHALAGGLGVEQTVGLLGLVQPPTVGEELINGNIVVRDEL